MILFYKFFSFCINKKKKKKTDFATLKFVMQSLSGNEWLEIANSLHFAVIDCNCKYSLSLSLTSFLLLFLYLLYYFFISGWYFSFLASKVLGSLSATLLLFLAVIFLIKKMLLSDMFSYIITIFLAFILTKTKIL